MSARNVINLSIVSSERLDSASKCFDCVSIKSRETLEVLGIEPARRG
jgi:hypothetical protein